MTKLIDPETERLVCEMYIAGEPVPKIMETAGVGSPLMYSILRRNGIERNRPQGRAKRAQGTKAPCVRCNEYLAHENYVLCTRCRAVTAIKREQAVRRMRRELA